jgi:L-threonylcarbamoyladenylate synthase
MRVLALTDDSILEGAETLRAGGTVVYPTETAYALGADPFNPEAVRRVFALKGRDERKPLGLLAASLEQVQDLCEMNATERLLAQRWPAALSLVLRILPREGSIREALDLVSAKTGTVSIRVSSYARARKLAETLGHPIITTSANRSGNGECFSVQEIRAQFRENPQPDYVLDGGSIDRGLMSTVVQVQDGVPVVLRSGAVDLSKAEDNTP